MYGKIHDCSLGICRPRGARAASRWARRRAVLAQQLDDGWEYEYALEDFKASNKPVLAFAPSYSQAQYLIASYADRIVLDENSFEPFGGVFLTGFSVDPLYYKTALDMLKIDVRVFAAGDYKDAAEPYTLDGMSNYSKEANEAWLNTLWEGYKSIVTTQRNISDESFHRYTNQYNELLAEAGNDPSLLSLNEGYVQHL